METMIYGNLKATPPDASGGTSQGGTMKAIALPKGACRKLDAKCYARQDAVTFQLDGIENGGVGVHIEGTRTPAQGIYEHVSKAFFTADGSTTQTLELLTNKYHYSNQQSVRVDRFGNAITSGKFTIHCAFEKLGTTNVNFIYDSGLQNYVCGISSSTSTQVFRNTTSKRIGSINTGELSVLDTVFDLGNTIKHYVNGVIVDDYDYPSTPTYTPLLYYFNQNENEFNRIVYNDLLTDAEIAYNYAIDKARFGI